MQTQTSLPRCWRRNKEQTIQNYTGTGIILAVTVLQEALEILVIAQVQVENTAVVLSRIVDWKNPNDVSIGTMVYPTLRKLNNAPPSGILEYDVVYSLVPHWYNDQQ